MTPIRLRRVASWLLLTVVVSSISASVAPAGAQEPDAGEEAGKVLIVATPHLTWDLVARNQPEHLGRLFEEGSVASTSVRTIGPLTDAGEGYLTLGAGNRAATDPLTDGLVLERDEPLTTGDPVSLYRRAMGIDPTAPILALGLPQILRENEAEHFDTEPGALATELGEHDRQVAVIGNADRTADSPTFRQAGLFGIDRTGQVAAGAVGRELLEPDDASSFGVRLSGDRVLEAFASAWATSDLVLFEMSDLARAEASRATSTPEQGDALFANALEHDDGIVGRLLERVDLDVDTVIVVGPVAPLEDEQLTVFSMTGAGAQAGGWATSSTTRRDGFVTLTDVAPTLLDRWGIEVPSHMTDTRITTSASDTPLPDKIERMVDATERASVRDDAFGVLTVLFIVVLVIDLILAVVCLARAPRLAPTVQVLALVVLWTPPVSYLQGLLPLAEFETWSLGLTLFGGALVLALVTWALGRRLGVPPPWVPVAATWLVLAVDVSTGAHLQLNTIFGYSPVVAGRFAGFGNQAFSMFAISALLMVTAWSERPGARLDSGRPTRPFLVGATVFFAITVIVDGLPSLGSDVGGVLAFVPAAATCLLLLAEVRIRVRTVLLIAGVTIASIVVFALIDLGRDAEDRTHLGRFASKVVDGDAMGILERKIAANISVLNSIWSWVIPVALVYFAYLTWRPNQTLRALNATHSGFRPFGVSGLVLGGLSMLLNDSGVSMPATMLAISLAYTTFLAVALERTTAPDDAVAIDLDGTATLERARSGAGDP